MGSARCLHISAIEILGLLILSVCVLPAQSPIPPNHPSISDNLVVWFTDPANTYDPATGVWIDSSGHGNDTATFTGNRNAENGVESSPFQLTTVTPAAGLFNGRTIDVVLNGPTFDSLVTPALNGGTGFSNLTMISLFSYATTNSLERLVGIGSFYLDDIRTAFMQSADGTIRKDNGFIAATAAPPAHHFVRGSVLSGDGITEAVVRDFHFDDAGAGFTATLNIDNLPFLGGHMQTGDDRLFLGDLRINSDGNSIAQVAFFNAALTDQEIADVAAWMAANPNAGSSAVQGMRIIEFRYSPGTQVAELTFTSRPGVSYTVETSSDLQTWTELDDGLPSGGETTMFTETGVDSSDPTQYRRYYRFKQTI